MASGTISNEGTSSTRYNESDTWDANTVGRFSSDIPASSYLEYPGGTTSVNNDYTLTDCAANPCFLEIVNNSSTQSTFTAEITKYGDESVFNAVEDATDPGN